MCQAPTSKMSFFESVVSMGKAAIQRIQSGPDPHEVRSVNPSDLAPVPTVDRHGSLVLCGPRTVGRGNAAMEIYEVVIHSEKYSFRSYYYH